MTVKAGRPLDLEIPYDAFPPPIMIWTKDGKTVQPEGDSQIKTSLDTKKCKLNM